MPTRGGPICCTNDPTQTQGMVDQTEVETRDDVLVYTSPVLESDLTIAGPLRADLYVSSSAKDTDLVVKLVDVFPDGRALNIQEGALRLRYRDSYVAPELMTPGQVYRVSVDMRAIAYQLPQGPPPAAADREQQLPAARAQSEYRRQQLRRKPAGDRHQPHPAIA